MAIRDIYEDGFDEELDSVDGECPECDGRVRSDGGERACTTCGLIVDEYHLDHRAPYIPEGEFEREQRAPTTVARHDRGLQTDIGRWRDGQGNLLSNETRGKLSRLRREHSRANCPSTREQNLRVGCVDIARIVGALELPYEVREEAALLFRRAQDADLLVGRAVEWFSAGCVYLACRCGGHVRTLEEVSRVAQCSREHVDLAVGVLRRDLSLPVPLQGPSTLIPTLVADLGLTPETTREALILARRAEEAGLANGPSPSGLASGCLYAVVKERGEDVTQAQIAEAAGVCPA